MAKLPKVGCFSEATKQEYKNRLEALKTKPDFQKTWDCYRVVCNGNQFQVQKRSWLGVWEQVQSSICLSSMRGGWPYGASADDAQFALIENVEREINELEQKKHGWQELDKLN